MGTSVIVNFMTVSHKGSTGISTAFPDVCKVPAPPAPPIPTPFPNVAMSGDLSGGSKKVKMDGSSICIKGCNLKTSTGDEAGVLNGLVSNKIKGKAEFVAYSFDVKVEGKNVCRLGDPTTQNMGSVNTAAFFHMQRPAAAIGGHAGVAQACAETKKKLKDPAEGPASSGQGGILPAHATALQEAVEKTRVMLYFRNTNSNCVGKGWIPDHQPKPHSVLEGSTIKDSAGEAKVNAWLAQNPTSPEAARGKRGGDLYGVVRSTREQDAGKPLRARGHYAVEPDRWITGDYDLMDVLKSKHKCKRPDDAEFGYVKYYCNKKMEWNGIQHPPQSQWDRFKEKAAAEAAGKSFSTTGDMFSVPAMMKDWIQTKKLPEKVVIEAGRDLFAPVDDNLTLFAPKSTAHLETHDDFYNALVCCGCKDPPPEPPPARA